MWLIKIKIKIKIYVVGGEMMVRNVEGQYCQKVLPIFTSQPCYDSLCITACQIQFGSASNGGCSGLHSCGCTYPCWSSLININININITCVCFNLHGIMHCLGIR